MNKKKFQKKNLINFYSSNFFHLKKKKKLNKFTRDHADKNKQTSNNHIFNDLNFYHFPSSFFFWFDQSH